MKKKLVVVMLFSLSVLFFLGIEKCEATEESKQDFMYQSDLSITFEGKEGEVPPNDKQQKPMLITENTKSDRLPQLGEMLKNLIIILVGISVLILILGVYFVQQVCKKNQLEVYE